MLRAGRTAGNKEKPMTEFHETRMGCTYYEHTMPTLVRELARLNGLLERVASALETHETAGEDGGGERGKEADDE